MPLSTIKSGYDLELQLGTDILRNLLSALWETGIAPATFLIPFPLPYLKIDFLVDPSSSTPRRYTANPNFVQNDEDRDLSATFQSVLLEFPEQNDVVYLRTRLAVVFTTEVEQEDDDAPPVYQETHQDLEAFLRLKAVIYMDTLLLEIVQFRTALSAFRDIPEDERDGETTPHFAWDNYFDLVTYQEPGLDFDPLQPLANQYDIPGYPVGGDAIIALVRLLVGVELDQLTEDTTSGFSQLFVTQQNPLNFVRLSKLAFHVMSGGSAGIYLNLKLLGAKGGYLADAGGKRSDGMVFTSSAASSLGIATGEGFLEKLVDDLIAKFLVLTRLNDGSITESEVAAALTSDSYPVMLPDSLFAKKDIALNGKLKSVSLNTKEKKFQLDEDSSKVKLTALEVKLRLNETLGKHFKLGGNNLLIYLVPYFQFNPADSEADQRMSIFVETNLRVNLFTSFNLFSPFLGYIFSAFTALFAKKAMIEGDLEDLIDQDLFHGWHPFKRLWDPFYSTNVGLAFNTEKVELMDNQIRWLLTTELDRELVPQPGTYLRAALLSDTEDLSLRYQLENIGGLLEGEFFTTDRLPSTRSWSDPEAGTKIIYSMELSGAPGAAAERISAGKLLGHRVFQPYCALKDSTRIEMLGLYGEDELDVLEVIVFYEQLDALVDAELRQLLASQGQAESDLTESQLDELREAVEETVEKGGTYEALLNNMRQAARAVVAQRTGEMRLLVSPGTLINLIDHGCLLFPGYVAVRQANGEVYFRNVPNSVSSDNLEELPACNASMLEAG